MTAEPRRLVIVGSGPAGYTAALYAARAELQPLLLAGSGMDPDIGLPGGQLMLTTDVENYPGFPDGVTGYEMMDLFRRQAERFGTEVLQVDATAVDLSARPFSVTAAGTTYTADSVIVATGARARWLGLPSEKEFMNRGVSACATCDGALYRGKEMAVVGGGDTAMEEALFLTRFATTVHVIHRRDALRASKIMAKRAMDNPKIRFVWDSAVEEVLGNEEGVTDLRLRNLKTGAESGLPVGALFIAIGHVPNTEIFAGALDLDDRGYVVVTPGATTTSVEGVFACGDVMDPTYRQAVTAAGTGCMAAIACERWLAEQESATPRNPKLPPRRRRRSPHEAPFLSPSSCCLPSRSPPPLSPARLRSPASGAASIDEPAPDLELPDLEGNLVSLRSFPGKIVVYDFWAVWCGPCVDSLPFLQELEDRYRDEGLVVVGLHVDDNVPSVEEVQAFLDEHGAQYVNLLSTVEADEAFRIFAMPTTYITDRDGVVRLRHIGFNPSRTPERLEQEVRDLLGLE